MVRYIVLLSVCMLFVDISLSKSWNYDSLGPSKWPTLYSTCGGTAQSPINIDSSNVVYDQSYLKPYKYFLTKSASDSTKNKLINTGKKFHLEIFENWTATFDPDFCFRPLGAHWHWGSDNSKGSEHQLDGKAFPIELHIVMYNCKDYKDPQAAVDKPNGLAVLGVLYEISDEGAQDQQLQEIVNKFGTNVKKAEMKNGKVVETSVELETFDLNKLLPSNKEDFYRYMGSLTTPPCTQNVMWTVLKETKKISQSQLNKFRSLQLVDGKPMSNNFRPVQKRNPLKVITTLRQVSASFNGASQQLSLNVYTIGLIVSTVYLGSDIFA